MNPDNGWNCGRARTLLILFLAVFTLGRLGVWVRRPLFPPEAAFAAMDPWPPPLETRILDATDTPVGRLVLFPSGTTVKGAVLSLGLKVDPLCSGFVLPRAGVAWRSSSGWRIRTMTQVERWVWKIPMDLSSIGEEELALIPGVGPVLAGRMYAFLSRNVRTRTVDSLDGVRGVGAKKLRLLKKYLEAD